VVDFDGGATEQLLLGPPGGKPRKGVLTHGADWRYVRDLPSHHEHVARQHVHSVKVGFHKAIVRAEERATSEKVYAWGWSPECLYHLWVSFRPSGIYAAQHYERRCVV
jgi:hypothetical protein